MSSRYFLTNDFDDPLSGFDTGTYIPCLRTDDLVFHLAKQETRSRLAACTGIELDGSLTTLRDSLRQLFEHFVQHGAAHARYRFPQASNLLVLAMVVRQRRWNMCCARIYKPMGPISAHYRVESFGRWRSYATSIRCRSI